MKNVLIRKATEKDLDKVLEMADQLSVADSLYDKEIDLKWANTPKGKKYYREKVLTDSSVCLLAEINQESIGFALAKRKEVPPFRKVKVVELEELFVKDKYRNKGIGKMLIDHFLNWAKDFGADKAAVDVYFLNEKGIKFYKREGFVPYDMILEIPLDKV